MEAKKSSTQYDKFTKQFGTNVFELEAVPPATLQDMLNEAIESVTETELFNKEVDAERQDAATLEVARQRACLALAGMNEETT